MVAAARWRQSRHSRLGLWGLRLGLAALSLALCAGVAEFLLRLRSDAPGESAVFAPYRSDDAHGYGLRPSWSGVHETEDFRVEAGVNALGLRGSEPAARRGARVLVLGDSFAFGWGVDDDETFAAILGSEDAALDVWNAAVPGFSADHHWLVLHERGDDFVPDLILVATCSNDLDDLSWNRFALDGEGRPLRIRSSRRLLDHRGRMRYVNEDRAVVPAWLETRFEGALSGSLLLRWLRLRVLKLWIGWSQERTRAARRTGAGPPPPQSSPIASLGAAALERGLASGAAFQLRYHRHLVAGIEEWGRDRNVPVRHLYVGPRGGPLHEECLAAGPRCLDATSLFRPESDPQLFHAADGHWNAEGHRRVARALADVLPSWLSDAGNDP